MPNEALTTEKQAEPDEPKRESEPPICPSCDRPIKPYEDDGSGLCEMCQWVLDGSG